MAHPTQRARQRSNAIIALRESCARLAERFGLVAPEIPERFNPDPSHLPTLQLEAVTAFMDSLVTAEEMSVGQQVDSAKLTALTAEVESLKAERDALLAAAKPVAKNPPKKRTPSPKPGRAQVSA